MNPEIADGALLLQQFFMGDNVIGKQMVKEAREVHFGENKFLVRLHWLCEFMWDGLGDLNEPRLLIAPLVRYIIVHMELHDGSDWEGDTEDNPLYPNDGVGLGLGSEDPACILPSRDIVARRARKRLEDLFLLTNAENVTLVLRGNGPLDGSDPATRQTIADISVIVRRLINFFGNRFAIKKWPLGKPHPTRSLLSYWNRPTDLTRRDAKEGRASFEQHMQISVEKWTREPGMEAVPEVQMG